MLELPNVTLCCVSCTKYEESIAALQYSMIGIKYAAVKFITDKDITIENTEVHRIKRLKTIEEYSKFIFKKLNKYFTTKFVLIVQWDGYVLNPDAWTDDFLNYDYIGAKWWYRDGANVGNGGFSLRSKKLTKLLQNDDNLIALSPEDHHICRTYRPYLESKGIKFAPEEVADMFSFETQKPFGPTFGFHDLKYYKRYKTVTL